jgi:hypothetical protein
MHLSNPIHMPNHLTVNPSTHPPNPFHLLTFNTQSILQVHLPTYLPTYLRAQACPSIHPIHLPNYLPTHPSIQSIHLPNYLPTHPSIPSSQPIIRQIHPINLLTRNNQSNHSSNIIQSNPPVTRLTIPAVIQSNPVYPSTYPPNHLPYVHTMQLDLTVAHSIT